MTKPTGRPRKPHRRGYHRRDLCEVDLAAVEQAIAGVIPGRSLNHCERIEAVRQLKARELTHVTIASRLGIPTRTVDRYSARLRTQAAA